jgi:hypothetical protein
MLKFAELLRRDGYLSLIVWVLARNPSLGFYSRLGGIAVLTKEIEIGGAQLAEVLWAGQTFRIFNDVEYPGAG